MAGKQQHQVQKKDFNDPFQAGQMVGMLVMLTFLEKNKGIPDEALQQLKWVTATNVESYFKKPAEDIFLMVNGMIGDIEIL